MIPSKTVSLVWTEVADAATTFFFPIIGIWKEMKIRLEKGYRTENYLSQKADVAEAKARLQAQRAFVVARAAEIEAGFLIDQEIQENLMQTIKQISAMGEGVVQTENAWQHHAELAINKEQVDATVSAAKRFRALTVKLLQRAAEQQSSNEELEATLVRLAKRARFDAEFGVEQKTLDYFASTADPVEQK